MKFIVSSSALLRHLSDINGIIVANPIVPILENFLFEIKDGKLNITASDLQTSIIGELAVEAKESASIAVPAHILQETLKNLPEQPITFSIDENTYTVEISSSNGRYKLAGENATDFPPMTTMADGLMIEIPAEVLKKAISHTIIAVSKDELKLAMNGVFIDLNDTGATFVATDTHRLVRYIRTDVSIDTRRSFIVPRKAFTVLNKLLPSDKTAIKIIVDENSIYFQLGNTQVISRLIDERYPAYENAIPSNNPNQLTINHLEFLSSLKRVAIYANKSTQQMRMKITGSELQISAEDLDFSNKASERLTCEYEGSDIELGFNAKLLIEMLSSIDTEEVEVYLSTPDKAGVILPKEKEENEEIVLLVMPVLLG